MIQCDRGLITGGTRRALREWEKQPENKKIRKKKVATINNGEGNGSPAGRALFSQNFRYFSERSMAG